MDNLRRAEEICGHAFTNKALLKTALTHSSFANENKAKRLTCNERVEFLGDSVLSLITSEYLFTHFADLPEGELTRVRSAVVCEKSLYDVAQRVGLGECLLLGRGEELGGGRKRPSILADAVEALLGAVFLDGGIDAARKFGALFLPELVEFAVRGRAFRDYKTELQEIVQKNRQETLSYRLESETGPDHDKRFVVKVLINSNEVASGEGRSKKEAEQNAAMAAMKLMGL